MKHKDKYREPGVLLWRGFTVQDCANQCFGNKDDNGKERQMPVHYGGKKLNCFTISSPIALLELHIHLKWTRKMPMLLLTLETVPQARLQFWCFQVVEGCVDEEEAVFVVCMLLCNLNSNKCWLMQRFIEIELKSNIRRAHLEIDVLYAVEFW